MVSVSFHRLRDLAVGPIVAQPPKRENVPEGRLGDQLYDLLRVINGMYAFYGALHVLPDDSAASCGERGLTEWNDAGLWRSHYIGLDEEMFFFAEDVFGGQFAITPSVVLAFDPETGDTEVLGKDIVQWVDRILADADMLTGWSLAQEWVVVHREIPIGHRLVPKKPFVIGGEFQIDNLYLIESVAGMRLRASIANQIAGISDGTTVRLRVSGTEEAGSEGER